MLPRGVRCLAVIAYALCLPSALQSPAWGKDAMQHLKEAEKPNFRKGHTLLPLTRWGWSMPYEVRIELTENWGYALEFGGYVNMATVKNLENPDSIESKLVALTAGDPERYPLSVLVDRAPTNKAFVETLPEETWCHDAEGKRLEKWGGPVWSPEAPDEVFKKAGEWSVEPLKKIRERAPIAMILDGGEDALNVYGHVGVFWEKDPVILKAKGERDWFDYISERKAHQQSIIADAIRQALPDRKLLLFYFNVNSHRNRYGDWWKWAFDYKHMRKVSDLPSSSIYYMHFNSGWTGNDDMLTQALNCVAHQHEFNEPLSYNWVCAGWTQEKLGEAAFGDLRRYMGYLKCYYTAGMIGAVAGYFAYPPGGFGADLGDQPPHWLQQMMILSHAHALFSHLEDFLRNGDLLPGPDKHRWSKEQPAYEFPTGSADARVLARKHREREQWLITAWAAGGEDRHVKVTIPALGEVTLLARDCGSVYRAELKDGQPVLTLIDEDGMLPTAKLDSSLPAE
jgi:hypothetical protein